ncbi:UNKNOWN [Stylonychia lemnae]|uniref:Uncharacterized protein n=1 Tax=Stylonychia lemnae TaxID=5949 RepID=A0A078AVR7_STYLE|nr:UNKNOWN [Stylonychia lemnae]|eukprot:CDW86176.1 UNKNOWN [Stylonychia lemnae]
METQEVTQKVESNAQKPPQQSIEQMQEKSQRMPTQFTFSLEYIEKEETHRVMEKKQLVETANTSNVLTREGSISSIKISQSQIQSPRQKSLVETQDHIQKMYKVEQERQRKIEDHRRQQEMQMRQQHPFQPQLNRSSSRKRTVNQIIDDLYQKNREESKSKERKSNLQLTKVNSNTTLKKNEQSNSKGRLLSTTNSNKSLIMSPRQQQQLFDRLYQESKDMREKKVLCQQQNQIKEEQDLFSPQISQKSKEIARKQLIQDDKENQLENNDAVAGGNDLDDVNSAQQKLNVFNQLTDDALRRRREQELIEAKLSQTQKYQLVSPNSINIISNKLQRDFDNALMNIKAIYPKFDLSENMLTEEQFVALLYTIGIFKEIGKNEEKQYDDILRLVTISNKQTGNKPIFSIRNTKVLVFSIFDIHQSWMLEQDKSEMEGSYHQRIQRYKLIRTKFKTHISDALKYSFLETPMNMEMGQDQYITDEEKEQYLEQQTAAGIGLIKGKSLCLFENDVRLIHKKFHRLYQNKINQDHLLKQKLEKEAQKVQEETFKPRINEKSHQLAIIHKQKQQQKSQERDNSKFIKERSNEGKSDQNKNSYEEQNINVLIMNPNGSSSNISIQERIQQRLGVRNGSIDQNQQKPKKNINYNRINQLYTLGKQKLINGLINEVERDKREEIIQLQDCTFAPKIKQKASLCNVNRRQSDYFSNNQSMVGQYSTKNSQLSNQKISQFQGGHKKSYSLINTMKKELNRTASTVSSHQQEQMNAQQQQHQHIQNLQSQQLFSFSNPRYSRQHQQNQQCYQDSDEIEYVNYNSNNQLTETTDNYIQGMYSNKNNQENDKDEIYLIEVILSENCRKQLKIRKSEDINIVARKFCIQNSKFHFNLLFLWYTSANLFQQI